MMRQLWEASRLRDLGFILTTLVQLPRDVKTGLLTTLSVIGLLELARTDLEEVEQIQETRACLSPFIRELAFLMLFVTAWWSMKVLSRSLHDMHGEATTKQAASFSFLVYIPAFDAGRGSKGSAETIKEMVVLARLDLVRVWKSPAQHGICHPSS